MSTCRFCVEQIPDRAIVCRACGRDQLPTASAPKVTLAAIDLPFNEMVWLLLKWTAACMPATIILTFVVMVIAFSLNALARILI